MGKLDIAGPFVLILLLLLGLRFDYYYDLNDDVLMKDILSGVYTGAFESRNVQMLFPLSLIPELCLQNIRNLLCIWPVLCVCQFGSLYVILYRSMGYAEKSMGKAALGLLESLLLPPFFCRCLFLCSIRLPAAC